MKNSKRRLTTPQSLNAYISKVSVILCGGLAGRVHFSMCLNLPGCSFCGYWMKGKSERKSRQGRLVLHLVPPLNIPIAGRIEQHPMGKNVRNCSWERLVDL